MNGPLPSTYIGACCCQCMLPSGLIHATPSLEEVFPLSFGVRVAPPVGIKQCTLKSEKLPAIYIEKKLSEEYTVGPYRLLNRGLYPLAMLNGQEFGEKSKFFKS